MNEELKTLGIGLSRLLRYSYGGFLLIALVSLFESDKAKLVREAMSWELVAVSAVVVGAGIYAVHRSVVIPLHHGLLCLVWWGIDKWRGIDESNSTSPTRWLKSIKVPFVLRISAYTALRGSDLFEKEKNEWNIAHAESGLVVMTAEALLVAAICAYVQTQPPVDWYFLVWSSGVFFVFSYAGFVQHVVECVRFQQEKSKVEEYLKQCGMIT